MIPRQWAVGLKKTAVSALGLLLVLCALEAALRVSGRMSARRSGADLRTKADNRGAFVILCLGDSFTYGCEAPEGRDYPRQLEEQFARRLPGRRVIVVNRGIPCANTHVLVENLPDQLARIHPDLVTVLIGVSNTWNFYGLDRSLLTPSWGSLRLARFVWLVWSLLRHDPRNPLALPEGTPDRSYLNPGVRDYWISQKQEPRLPVPPEASAEQQRRSSQYRKEGQALIFAGRFREAADLFRKGIQENPGNTDLYAEYSESLHKLGGLDEALPLLETTLTRYPGLSSLHSLLAEQQYKAGYSLQSARTAIRAIRLFPDQRPHYDKLLAAIQDIPDTARRQGLASQLRQMDDGSPLMREYILYIDWLCRYDPENRGRQIRRWILADLENLSRICAGAGVPMLLQNYPRRFELMPDFERFASGHHIPFADQFAAFSKIPDSASFFATSHCNEKGYAKMAEILFDRITEGGFIPAQAASPAPAGNAPHKQPDPPSA